MCSRYHRLLIYDGKRTTKIDGMGTFKLVTSHLVCLKPFPRDVVTAECYKKPNQTLLPVSIYSISQCVTQTIFYQLLEPSLNLQINLEPVRHF